MRRFLRTLTVLVAMFSLVGGTWLPADASAVVDADGICGPVLSQGMASSRVAEAHGAAGQKHCLYCHWRHTMASASAAAFVAVPGPIEAGLIVAGRPSPQPTITEVGAAAPRGPPSLA